MRTEFPIFLVLFAIALSGCRSRVDEGSQGDASQPEELVASESSKIATRLIGKLHLARESVKEKKPIRTFEGWEIYETEDGFYGFHPEKPSEFYTANYKTEGKELILSDPAVVSPKPKYYLNTEEGGTVVISGTQFERKGKGVFQYPASGSSGESEE